MKGGGGPAAPVRLPDWGVDPRFPDRIGRWVCYYGLDANPDRYTGVDLAVFNARWHPPLVGGHRRPAYCGYVSVGEVDTRGDYWARVAGRSLLVRENPRWGSWVVDVRRPYWQSLLTEDMVPAVLAEGFDGLFLDTLDAALSLAAWNDGQTLAQLKRSLLGLLETIRRRHPRIGIIVNRGLSMLADMAPLIDAVVVEGLSSVFCPERGAYAPVAPDTRQLLLDQLRSGLCACPRLPVLTLDYAARFDDPLASAAAQSARACGFVPYVGDAALHALYPPPV